MAKRKSLIGVNNFVKQTKKRRPGRHSKKYNKRVPRRKKIEDKENNNGNDITIRCISTTTN